MNLLTVNVFPNPISRSQPGPRGAGHVRTIDVRVGGPYAYPFAVTTPRRGRRPAAPWVSHTWRHASSKQDVQTSALRASPPGVLPGVRASVRAGPIHMKNSRPLPLEGQVNTMVNKFNDYDTPRAPVPPRPLAGARPARPPLPRSRARGDRGGACTSDGVHSTQPGNLNLVPNRW